MRNQENKNAEAVSAHKLKVYQRKNVQRLKPIHKYLSIIPNKHLYIIPFMYFQSAKQSGC